MCDLRRTVGYVTVTSYFLVNYSLRSPKYLFCVCSFKIFIWYISRISCTALHNEFSVIIVQNLCPTCMVRLILHDIVKNRVWKCT